jgi:hypothetical protein
MKLTKSQIKQIIKEELSEVLKEFAAAAGGSTSTEMPLKGILSKEAEKDWNESPSIINDRTAECESKGQCYDIEAAKCIPCPEGTTP